MSDYVQKYYLEACETLPRSQDEFFRQLWRESRLKFESPNGKADLVDISSAKILCAALTRKQPLLIILPDHASRRIPLLFATGLIMHTLDNLGKAHDHRVIYFGTGAAIKDYLSYTLIRTEKLSDIFKQIYLSHTIKSPYSISDNLPSVVFSYSPINPEQIIDFYRPKWVFMDCGDGENIGWTASLIQKLAQERISCIACVNNQLSRLTEEFEANKWGIFSWVSSNSSSPEVTKISPIIIQSQMAYDQSEKLHRSHQLLHECSRNLSQKLQIDAWRTVGQYINSLENLLTPLPFFEAESRYHWGIYSIQALRSTAEHFIEALGLDDIRRSLQLVVDEANWIHERLSQNKPPFWIALQELCIDPPLPRIPTVLVFPNRAYKQLFSLAMLAENNIAENELQKLNVWLISLKQFVQWQLQLENSKYSGIDADDVPSELKNTHPSWNPILIGVPIKNNYARYSHLLQFSQISNLLLPHQERLANWHYRQWIIHYDMVIAQNLFTLKNLNPVLDINNPLLHDETITPRIVLTPSADMLVEDGAEPARARFLELLQLSPRIEELAYLIDTLQPESETNPISDVNSEGTTDFTIGPDITFVEKAIIVYFKEGYEVAFNLSDKIQLIVTLSRGKDLQERSVRSLKPGDIVLFINGQQRQSLYDLIVSRVHNHPTFALHISLIERWQDELVSCYKKAGLPLSDLLSQMRAKGSSLQTETAIRFWIGGQVMCPMDSKDLKRISDILHMPFVQQYYLQIDRAARRLRGIHISLARKLNVWLEQEAFSSSKQSFNEIVDAELGLEFKDFQESLMILTVVSVKEESGLFLATDLGQIKRSNNIVPSI